MGPMPHSRTVSLEAFTLHLGLLAWLITRQLSQQLRDFELTLPQFVVLIALSGQRESCLMSQLAHLTRQTPATLTGIVDRLEKAGLVQRTGSKTDRRMVLVQATLTGIDLAKQIQAEFLQKISCHFASLTNETLFTVEQTLLLVLAACTEETAFLLPAILNDEPQNFLLAKTPIPT